jgi:hypothetical protein
MAPDTVEESDGGNDGGRALGMTEFEGQDRIQISYQMGDFAYSSPTPSCLVQFVNEPYYEAKADVVSDASSPRL